MLGESKTLRFGVKNTGGLVRFRLLQRTPSASSFTSSCATRNAEHHQQPGKEQDSDDQGRKQAEGVNRDVHRNPQAGDLSSGAGSHPQQQQHGDLDLEGSGGLKVDTDDHTATVSVLSALEAATITGRNDGGGVGGDRGGGGGGKVDFDDPSFDPEGSSGSLEVCGA